jgi:ribosomal protein S6--L-glutamate ligase
MWMYSNGGGDAIQQKIEAKLREREIGVTRGLDLRFSEAKGNEILCNGVNMMELDLFFSYNAGEQTLSQVYFYEVLNDFIPTVNSFRAFELSEDKFRTNMVLAQAGVRTSDFFTCHREADHEGLYDRLDEWGKMVFKPVDGWGGTGMALLDTRDKFDMLMPFINQIDIRNIYVERFIKNDYSDYRVDIVDGQFVGCYGRKAGKRDWRTNITSGGSVILREPTDGVVDIALRASEALGMDIAGVDILYDIEREEYVVLEVNGIPAFATPEQEAMGLNFNDRKIDLIVEMIDRKTR